jgi:tetratricopeptide (TPR) repeat protein
MFDLRASLSWRLKEAGAFLRQGDEFADSAALRVAINGYRAILVVAPQALGAEANAMVEKELCKALRILSDRENDTQGMDDLAEAILMCEEALKVLTAERHPVDWAVTKSSLAIAVMSLGRRTGANEPLKHAEAMFRELLVLDVQSSSDRSKTKGNLASVLRLLGNVEHDSKRLDEATHLFRQALTEISLDRDPMTWSAVQNNLGATYRLWGQMESSVSLLRQAEESYKQALSVISRERAPYQWAQITDNMALVLLLLGRCTSSRETLQNALALADSALEIFHKADSKPDIDLAEGRRASIQRELNDLPSKTNCAA